MRVTSECHHLTKSQRVQQPLGLWQMLSHWKRPHKVFLLHTLQLCHIGLECCWGRNRGVTPIQIHFSPPICELLGLENKHAPPFHPHSAGPNTAAGFLGCRHWEEWERCVGVSFDTEVTGCCWLLERRWQMSTVTVKLQYTTICFRRAADSDCWFALKKIQL